MSKAQMKQRGRTGLRRPRVVAALAALICLITGVAAAWWNDEWSARKEITIDTTAEGAGLSQPVGRMPALIRLHDGVFPFVSAQPGGEDLRLIAGDDTGPLNFHIEKFDSLVGTGLVWVSLPDLPANATQNIWLYYGNSAATAVGDPAATYDDATVLVYHFADAGLPPQDSSQYEVHATNLGLSSNAGQIGDALKLDGRQLVEIPPSRWLAFPDGAEMTLSVWVKVDTAEPDAILFSRRFGANAFLLGVDETTPFVEVASNAGTVRVPSSQPITERSWHHLAVTATASELTLYLNGKPVGSAATSLPGIGGPATLGGDPNAPEPVPAAAPVAAGEAGEAGEAPAEPAPPAVAPEPETRPFIGEIDELRIARVARSPDYIAAVYASEGAPPRLAVVNPETESSSWFEGGYMVIILQSVTVDGWVVIGILIIFAVISWVVMVSKANLVSRLAKANHAFRAVYDPVVNDLDLLDELDPDVMLGGGQPLEPQVNRQIRRSPLYHLFVSGADEIRGRCGDQGRGPRSKTLSPQMLAAIRARLDGRMVREMQTLNRSMVTLTMAIAGGPFLGLLGTCIGVMITFAGIAAVGEVNITAIAPGVAAALSATVAGLGVAIPALFGYNYLLVRIKTIQADMQVFIDEFITKLAEVYSGDKEPQTERLAAE